MTNADWSVLQQAFPIGRWVPERQDDRKVMNKIFFLCRTAIPWRELPECCGPYTTCYDRCRKNGDWLEILARLQSFMDMNDDPDRSGANALQTRLIDSSAVRAHRYAAGSHPDGGSLQLGEARAG